MSTSFQAKLASLQLPAPVFHVVLGSGFKDSLVTGIPPLFKIRGEILFSEIEGLHPSSAPGHAGKFVLIQHEPSKKLGVIQVGRLHGYEGLEPREVVRTVMCTRELGCEMYYLTNAAGGMGDGFKTGDVMLIEDQINLSGKNPLFGPNPVKPNGEPWGPRFQDVTKLFDQEKTTKLSDALRQESLRVHRGVYIGVPGPVFETPAEVRFYKQIGAHSVGMSTVWESLALKHSQASVVGVSLISNIAAGLERGPNGEMEELDHFAILDACKVTSVGILKAILKTAEQSL